MRFDEFVLVYRRARRQIRTSCNPTGAMVDVMSASRYLSGCSRREVNLATAYAVEIENLVQPDHVHPDDKAAARRCIGSNGKYAMPVRDWAYEG